MKLFDHLRARRLRRTDDGILAGVCSGLAHRWGVSAVLVRIGAIALSAFLAGIPLFFYGLAWLLMPAYHEDSIVLEDLFSGHVSSAVAGGFAALIVGSWMTVTFPTVFYVYFGTTDGFLRFVFYALVLPPSVFTLVWAFFSRRRRRRSESEVTSATLAYGDTVAHNDVLAHGNDLAHGKAAGSGVDKSLACDASEARYATTPQPMPATTPPRPRREKKPAVSGPYILIVLAIAILAGLFAFVATGFTLGGALAGCGTLMAMLAVGIIVGALQNRRGTWLTFTATLLALPLSVLVGAAYFVPSQLMDIRLDSQFITRSEATGSKSVFANVGDTEVAKLNDGDVLSSVVESHSLFVNPEDPVIITIHGTGSVQLTDNGGWRILSESWDDITKNPTFRNWSTGEELKQGDTVKIGDLEILGLNTSDRHRNIVRGVPAADNWVKLYSPAAQATTNPDEIKRITVDYGFGEVRVFDELASGVGLSHDDEWGPSLYMATNQGITVTDNQGKPLGRLIEEGAN